MAKKENPNLIFRKEWWDNLRHKSPELFKDALSILFSTYFDGKDFDPYAFDEQGSNPTPAQDLAIPMVKTAKADRETYIAKCEKLKANVSKRYFKDTNVPENLQLNTFVNNCSQQSTIVGNIIEGKGIEGNIKEDIFFLREETSPEKEKKEILFSLSFFFLAKGVLRPYTTAEKAWNYNESQGWKFTNKNGSVKDCSKNKLAFLKGWDCEGLQYPLDQGDFFACFCQATGLLTPETLDDFHGCHPSGDAFLFLFDHKKTADTFNTFFKSTPDTLNKAHCFIRQTHPQCTRGFKATLYKQE